MGQAADRPVASGPLVGLRVIDVGQLIAGPLVGTILADWGADVVKIEQPGTGDPLRQLGPRKDDVPVWWKINGRNKRSIALDLHRPDHRVVLREFARTADILVENFTPGTMESWELGYETLSRANPGLIMVRVSAYGQSGPYRDRRGFGRSAEGFGGLAFITGFEDRPPVHAGVPLGDYVGSLTAVAGSLAAVAERNRSGLGQVLDVALYESVFRMMELPVAAYDQLGQVTGRDGTTNSYVAPAGTWRSGDGRWISFTASTQPVVRRLFEAMGLADLASDERFSTNANRLRHRETLSRLIADWVAGHEADELAATLDKHAVPYSVALSIADTFEDRHYRDRGTLPAVADAELDSIRMPAVVPRFSRTPGAIRWAGEPLNASWEDLSGDGAWHHSAPDTGAAGTGGETP
jgi:crotonobetainyl-CoA:carnitine CoA-transferase CaiB-like acyl-CoA transferase